MWRLRWFGWVLLLLLGASCSPVTLTPPTRVAAAATVAPAATARPTRLPATWTPLPGETAPALALRPTFTPRPTRTRLVLPTATATATPTPPTSTPAATATASATPLPTPAVIVSENLLPNPSFEGGSYHPNGIPELQIPEQWTFEYVEGDNWLDPDPWNRWVRPEARLLSPPFLPPHEHDLFIWDGRHTLKVFKGYGAVHFRMLTDVELAPGTYLFRVNAFPDMVDQYLESGTKIWAPDPLSGDTRFLVDGRPTPWVLVTFGQKNTFSHTFSVTEARTVRLGVAFRGRWAITNNGWFLDDWALYRVADP